jgi:hypothetical protein
MELLSEMEFLQLDKCFLRDMEHKALNFSQITTAERVKNL